MILREGTYEMRNFVKKKGGSHGISIELVFAILIAVCIIANTVVYHTYIDIADNRYNNSIFIPEAYIGRENKELEELIKEYHPDPTRMIEIYDTDFNLESRIIIDRDEYGEHDHYDIKDFPKLVAYLNDNDEGHTYYMNDKRTETDFYFTWYITEGKDGNRQLVLIFMSRPKNVPGEIHDSISYIILGLSFGIIISIYNKESKRNRKLLNNYQKIDSGIEI